MPKSSSSESLSLSSSLSVLYSSAMMFAAALSRLGETLGEGFVTDALPKNFCLIASILAPVIANSALNGLSGITGSSV